MKKELAAFLEKFENGTNAEAEKYLGSHLTKTGAVFRVWAPEAEAVFVSGDFNSWSCDAAPMNRLEGGIWELRLRGVSSGQAYKYVIRTRDDQLLWKADPYGVYSELRPNGATRLWELDGFEWKDGAYIAHRRRHLVYESPMNVYEVHSGSWRRHEDGSFLSYRELAEELTAYVKDMGFTHIELMPLTEYPYDASWGYQCTGYFAATSRYGTPQDLMYLIDKCHRAGIGVIMDWVPAHFPKDPHGLVEFDGSRLYEPEDANMAEHPSWGTRVFDYGKGQVKSFLISSAIFWLREFHLDGLRVDAVSSMLYLDYDRRGRHWTPNKYGGNENLEAIAFMQELNKFCFADDDSILMIAEESTAWPMVTAPVFSGGLGFNLKWNMGWMNDTLRYLSADPLFRGGCHDEMTFSLMYAFSENFILPLSHDEVVHMKGSLYYRAPGSESQKLANLRTYRAFMLSHPGKQLIFMGDELAQESEWDYAGALPWTLTESRSRFRDFYRETNLLYKKLRPLWDDDFNESGFSWISADDRNRNLLAFNRRSRSGTELTCIFNFSGTEQRDIRLGVSGSGDYSVVMSTDEARFGGGGALTGGEVFSAEKLPCHGRKHSLVITLPPLTAVWLKRGKALKTKEEKTEG